MVFQSSLLYPHMTARQNIAASLAKQGLDKRAINARIEEAAATVDVTALLDKLPSQLSGGERQRVATAKAIVRQPSAFLLDEPLAALDAALRLTLRSELVNLQKRLATTMVFVTHDQVEAMTMGDRIAVMNDGKLEQVGTPDEIYNSPATLFVAAFVGTPPMNIIAPRDAVPARDLVDLPDSDGGAWRQLVGGENGAEVTLGVRPQHLRISPEPNGGMPVTVFALEHLGRESVLILDNQHQNKLRALVEPGFRARVGDQLFASPDPQHCLFFDEAGKAIAKPATDGG